jgi:hypothetical protein
MEQSGRAAGPRSRAIPITGVSLFIVDRKAEAAQAHPELTKVQLFALLNDQWNTLDDATKETYERKADYSRRMESRRQNKNAKETTKSKISPYSVFTRERHESLKTSNPEMTVGDRAKIIAAEWNSKLPADKISFINAAKRETRKMWKISVEEESEDDSDQEDGSL